MLPSMPRRKQTRPTYTVNQVVASNVAKARMLRSWTQQEAADALAPHLGTKMSTASFSAIERSVDGGRVREFDADEVFAFARGFGLPIGWFFTPPSPIENIGVAAPDAPTDGLDPQVLLDALLGTNETVDAWRQLLLSWPLMTHRMRLNDDGSAEYLGREEDDVHPRLDILRELRAGMSVRDALGDIDEARHVLLQLADLLADLDNHATDDSASTTPARSEPKAPKK